VPEHIFELKKNETRNMQQPERIRIACLLAAVNNRTASSDCKENSACPFKRAAFDFLNTFAAYYLEFIKVHAYSEYLEQVQTYRQSPAYGLSCS